MISPAFAPFFGENAGFLWVAAVGVFFLFPGSAHLEKKNYPNCN